jgi:dsRNA-specific ribonuclease
MEMREEGGKGKEKVISEVADLLCAAIYLHTQRLATFFSLVIKH